ncbi:MAG: endonuclease, partial [Gammaproteobacteria bacterium]|nr:endonuclease [Gammaproteobacteria bacterium]
MTSDIPEKFNSDVLLKVYQRMFDAYGPQDWWPADTPFEVMVGAVLTQNTAWVNVEKAINNLKQNSLLSLDAIVNMPEARLADLVRSSGYFNVKARRLHNLCRWLVSVGDLNSLASLETYEFRTRLLSINGIGPETADDILLYAFNRPVFVIDAYTRRLFSKLKLIHGKEPYESLRR